MSYLTCTVLHESQFRLLLQQLFRYMNVCRQFDAKSVIYHRGLQPSSTGSLLFLVFHQHDVVKVRSQQYHFGQGMFFGRLS